MAFPILNFMHELQLYLCNKLRSFRTAKDMMSGGDLPQQELAAIITDAKTDSEKHTCAVAEIEASIFTLDQRARKALSQVPWADSALSSQFSSKPAQA